MKAIIKTRSFYYTFEFGEDSPLAHGYLDTLSDGKFEVLNWFNEQINLYEFESLQLNQFKYYLWENNIEHIADGEIVRWDI